MFRSLQFAIVLVSASIAVCVPSAQADQKPMQADAALTIADVTALLDHDQPADVRQAALKKATALAKEKNTDALALLGTLYAWGKEHPSALLDKDNAKAETYLSNAAVAGYFLVIPRLVAVELALNKPDAAIVWATVYLYYRKNEAARNDKQSEQYAQNNVQVHSAIAAELVQRCAKILGAAYNEKTVQEDAEAVIKQYGGHFDPDDAAQSVPFYWLNPHALSPKVKWVGQGHFAGNASPSSEIWEQQNVLIVRENGRIERQYLFDATPGSEADAIRAELEATFTHAPAGSGMRIIDVQSSRVYPS